MARRQRLYRSQKPVFVLVGRKQVHIQDSFPFRVWRAKFFKRRSSPDAARMIGVFPDVIDEGSAPADERNVVRPVIDRDTLAAIYDGPDNIPFISRRGAFGYN